ncbi:TetR/AcrR family transcriptional regulator [Camelliibacillus cellulosilyticus]|uniref:TetR/AcrR family transcriptional regulator n=1 Tax=Camelliibacillus cellulosilyticus TaxID=2174486 RepID=A0ABV9GMY1_9BACL
MTQPKQSGAANSRQRLIKAAIELFMINGFEQTTVVQIAARANLTERTFFRHFADKREVLFSGSNHLTTFLLNAIQTSDADMSAFEIVFNAFLQASETIFDPIHIFAMKRYQIINANPELQERECLKLANVSKAISQTLQERGLPMLDAELVSHSNLTLFRIAYEQWATHTEALSLVDTLKRVRSAWKKLH